MFMSHKHYYIMSHTRRWSDFKSYTGYKQCSFKVTKPAGEKRCHRAVKVEKEKEDGYCGRHQKRQKLERDPIDTANNKEGSFIRSKPDRPIHK